MLTGLLLGACVPQALYYAHVNSHVASPGLLAFIGIGWNSLWSVPVLLAVFLLGGISPVVVMTMTVLAGYGRHFRMLMVATVVSWALVWAIPVGNMAGYSLYWWEGWRSGLFRVFRTDVGLLGMMPGIMTAMVSVLLVVAMWVCFGRLRKRNVRLERTLYASTPAICLIASSVTGGVHAKSVVAGIVFLSLFLGVIIPNELSACAYCIRTGREAYWMWAFAAIIVWEVFMMIFLVVCIMYQL